MCTIAATICVKFGDEEGASLQYFTGVETHRSIFNRYYAASIWTVAKLDKNDGFRVNKKYVLWNMVDLPHSRVHKSMTGLCAAA